MNWWSRLLSNGTVEKQLDSELRHHFELSVEENVRRGMPRNEALRQARIEFGGMEQIKEECREARGTQWVENSARDTRYALRSLWKQRGFAGAAICTLAIGIGANTAIFNVINGNILRPLPYPSPGQLAAVEQALRTGESWTFSYPDFLDCSRQSKSFQSLAAWRNRGANVTKPGDPAFLPVRMVSAAFLDVLEIRPVVGRNFTAQEDQPGTAPVAIISYSFWQQRFGGRDDVLNSQLVLNDRGYTVVGVLPARFRFLDDRPIFTPIGQSDEIWMRKRDAHPGIQAIGRLKPGIDLQKANTELRVIGSRLAQEYPDTDAKFTFRALSLRDQIVGRAGRTLLLLGGAVGLVLLIACVNVANLFLARSVSRDREFAVRSALGASRSRLSQQLLTESLVLSFTGGLLGLVIAGFGTHWAIVLMPQWLPRMNDVSVDTRVLLFAFFASIFCGIGFGLTPLFRQKADLERSLRQAGHGSRGGVQHIQRVFVVAELALAFVLLAGAGLMLRTILQIWGVSPGFDSHNILTMGVTLPPTDLKNPALIRNGWQQLVERVKNTSGVESVALDSIVPLSGESQHLTYWQTAETKPPKNAARAWLFTPTPDYLHTMEISLLEGRFFTSQDRVGSAPVIVIDETLAKRLFPRSNPINQELSIQFMGRVRIVGVLASIKHLTLDEDVYSPREPAVYIPFLQFPDAFMEVTTTGMQLLVRTSADPTLFLQGVKASVMGPLRDTPIRSPATMDQIIGDSTAQRSGIAWLLGLFAALALILSAVGIYSVIAYAMSQRTAEIGVRMALGATPGQVLSLVLAQGLRMIGVGVLVGLAVAFAVTRLLSKLLFGVTPIDPLAFSAAVAILCSIALFAIYFPARRAARIDPISALRYD